MGKCRPGNKAGPREVGGATAKAGSCF
ncbi:hypothetical protein CCACVL1_08154 [Corchorus capsularis]|uniref:Uncharacterized protein n=1 Tax=Corchorus capsularis TaxID=210143 RepID=A0A1R3J208_COCAP|nr:hypothetical protein CCACVL1_08154 [Corchorus capsularis]